MSYPVLAQAEYTLEEFRADVRAAEARILNIVRTVLPEQAEAAKETLEAQHAEIQELYARFVGQDVPLAELEEAEDIRRKFGLFTMYVLGGLEVKVREVKEGILDRLAAALGISRNTLSALVFLGLGVLGLTATASLVSSLKR